jgi:hypothetical protein
MGKLKDLIILAEDLNIDATELTTVELIDTLKCYGVFDTHFRNKNVYTTAQLEDLEEQAFKSKQMDYLIAGGERIHEFNF